MRTRNYLFVAGEFWLRLKMEKTWTDVCSEEKHSRGRVQVGRVRVGKNVLSWISGQWERYCKGCRSNRDAGLTELEEKMGPEMKQEVERKKWQFPLSRSYQRTAFSSFFFLAIHKSLWSEGTTESCHVADRPPSWWRRREAPHVALVTSPSLGFPAWEMCIMSSALQACTDTAL